MDRTLLIGVGAAGNKAVIEAVESGVVLEDEVLLINSTDRDLPEKYKSKATIISDGLGGCGKEPSRGQALMVNAIAEKKLLLEQFMVPEQKSITIVGSTEGGTGCGGVPVLAKYGADKMHKPVHVIGFMGFKEDTRGIKNTLTFLSKMQENFDVQLIQNSMFLDEAEGNQLVAERLANKDFCHKLAVMLGNYIAASSQNMDEMDIYKVVNTCGYKVINYMEINEKIKTHEQFNDLLKKMMNTTSSLEADGPTQQKMASIINLPTEELDNIDINLEVVKKRYGTTFEHFKHIEDTDELPRFIATISSGFKMPISILEKLNKEYTEASDKISKDEDLFFAKAKELSALNADMNFDMGAVVAAKETPTAKKDNDKAMEDFLKSFS